MRRSRKVLIVTRDTDRNRDLFWAAHVDAYTYYEEHATVFDSAAEARIYMKYAGITDGIPRAAGKYLQ